MLNPIGANNPTLLLSHYWYWPISQPDVVNASGPNVASTMEMRLSDFNTSTNGALQDGRFSLIK